MLYFVIGKQGSGKTFLLVYIATESERDIYSNFFLKLKNYNPLSLVDLIDLKDNIDVLIDEGYTWLESRTSSSKLNRFLSYIILQARKRTIDIYLTAQMASSVDKRFRKQADIIVRCKRIKNNKFDGFRYRFFNVSTGKVKTFTITLELASEYFNLYDTYEIIETSQMKGLELELLEQDSERLKEKIIEIADIIKPKLNKITHDSISNVLLMEKIHIGYKKYLYPYLKEHIKIDDIV